MSTSALASLTAQYTDSENEEENRDDDNSTDSQVIIPKPKSPVTRKRSPDKPTKPPKKKRSKKVRRLVSYQDDTIISDEEELGKSETSESESESDSDDSPKEGDHENGSEEGQVASSKKHERSASPAAENNADENNKNPTNSPIATQSPSKHEKYAHYNFSLPPEPKGKPSNEVVEKIRQLYEKMQSNHMDMNAIIQRRKEFRNPSIYKKLIEFCDINEFGTNYPPEIYDPLRWGPESYYEELARVQKNEMIKRRRDTDKIEQATALARKVEEEAKKRKSKWDQPAKPIGPATLTTTVTGTKGTVISAFGSLPKKPVG